MFWSFVLWAFGSYAFDAWILRSSTCGEIVYFCAVYFDTFWEFSAITSFGSTNYDEHQCMFQSFARWALNS
jgi:hypothetical protein